MRPIFPGNPFPPKRILYPTKNVGDALAFSLEVIITDKENYLKFVKPVPAEWFRDDGRDDKFIRTCINDGGSDVQS
jgi:hypothetical protein